MWNTTREDWRWETEYFLLYQLTKDVTVIRVYSHPQRWAAELWWNSGRKEYLPSRILWTPYGEPWGNSGCEIIGCSPQVSEEHIKGMIQETTLALISIKFLSLRYLVFFSLTTFDIQTTWFLLQNFYKT